MQAATLLAESILGWAAEASAPLLVGLCGSQGSGKSTVAGCAADLLTVAGLRTVALSLDDFYLTRAERRRLAREAHPLFATRGPPGTHDVTLALNVLDALQKGDPVRLPRFDKLSDDRLPEMQGPLVEGDVGVILFEGWCVGAAPQSPEALIEPINDLERGEDVQRVWCTAVNDALAGLYARLHARLDRLAMLKAPDFAVVAGWRLQQERAAAAAADEERQGRAMGGAQVARFIQHYERLTRWMLAEVPARADLVLELDENRAVARVRTPAG